MLRNEEERAQALRVVRRVVAIVGSTQGVRRQRGAFVEQGLLRCLAAVARAASAGDGTGDRLSRPAIATLAEICKYCRDISYASLPMNVMYNYLCIIQGLLS